MKCLMLFYIRNPFLSNLTAKWHPEEVKVYLLYSKSQTSFSIRIHTDKTELHVTSFHTHVHNL